MLGATGREHGEIALAIDISDSAPRKTQTARGIAEQHETYR
jgi:hypothetical protein